MKNRIYIGEIVHKGQSFPGEHDPIIDPGLFETVQARLADNLKKHRAKRGASNALLLGRLFDDAGNRMTPSTTRKHGLIHRYYISRALLEGRKNECGSHPRVAADQVESLIVDALKARLQNNQAANLDESDDRMLLEAVERIVVGKSLLRIELADVADTEDGFFEIPWAPRGPGRPKREVLQPAAGVVGDERAMRPEVRTSLIRAIALGRLWLRELTSGNVKDTDEIAVRESRSKRSVHMTMSLAFLAPDIVDAAVEGSLPRRIGITRLIDLPPSWQKQREMLGLRQPSSDVRTSLR